MQIILINNIFTGECELHEGKCKSLQASLNAIAPELQTTGYSVVKRDGTFIVIPAVLGIETIIIAAIVVGAAVGYLLTPKVPSSPEVDQLNVQSSSYSTVGLRRNQMRAGGVIPCIYGQVLIYPDLVAKQFSQTSSNKTRHYSVMSVCDQQATIGAVYVEGETDSQKQALALGQVDLASDDYSLSAYKVGYGSFDVDVPARISLNKDTDENLLKVGNGVSVNLDLVTSHLELELRYYRPAGEFHFQVYYTSNGGDRLFALYRVSDQGVFESRFPGYVETQVYTAPSDSTNDNAFTLSTPLVRVFGNAAVIARRAEPAFAPGAQHVLNIRQAYVRRSGRTVTIGTGIASLIGDNLVASNSRPSIAVNTTRKLKPFNDQTLALRDSKTIADAIVDIAQIGGVSYSDIDVDKLTELNTVWSARGDEFNAIFDKPSNVFDSIKAAAFCGRTRVIRRNNDTITFVRDQYKPVITMRLNDNQIVEGSFKVAYQFDKRSDYDGVKIRYRTLENWVEEQVCWPSTATNPDNVTLFGCTSDLLALDEAKYQWAVRTYRRKSIDLNIEKEGFLLSVGDRIEVTYSGTKYDVIIESIRPRDRFTVALECVDYDERIYQATNDPAIGTSGVTYT